MLNILMEEMHKNIKNVKRIKRRNKQTFKVYDLLYVKLLFSSALLIMLFVMSRLAVVQGTQMKCFVTHVSVHQGPFFPQFHLH